MSASHHQTYAISPGAELLEKKLETPTRRKGNAAQPTRGRELKQPPAVMQLEKANLPAAGTNRDGTPIRSAGGTYLTIVQAKLWNCEGMIPDFYMANCPGCRSTIQVGKPLPDLNSLNTCKCGTPFFAALAAA